MFMIQIGAVIVFLCCVVKVINGMDCHPLMEIEDGRELRKLAVVNTYKMSKIYGPLSVNNKTNQLVISRPEQGAQWMLRFYKTDVRADFRIFIQLVKQDIMKPAVGEMISQNDTGENNSTHPYMRYFDLSANNTHKEFTACDLNLFVCSPIWSGREAKECIQVLKDEESFQLKQYDVREEKYRFLCGSPYDYTMSMRLPNECVGFDTFRWLADNGESSILHRLVEWGKHKPPTDHIMRSTAERYSKYQSNMAPSPVISKAILLIVFLLEHLLCQT